MKLTPIAALLSLTSLPALAIENGTALDWQQHDNLVEMNCTGTIIGGDLVLTADHCKWDSAGGLRPVTLSNGTQVETRKQISSPIPSTDAAYFDIGLWQLASAPSVSAFTVLSPIEVTTGDNVTILGFGQTQQQLNQAVKEIDYISNTGIIFGTTNINQGVTAPGDSGAPTLQDNKLIGVHNGGQGGVGNEAKLSYKPARDFILNTVNGWHYPTVAKTINGKADIPIQSLFAENQGTGAISLFNEIIAEGDIDFAIDPNCQSYEPKNELSIATPSDMKPFDLCTIHVTANNDAYGVLTIRNTAGNGKDAIITINPQVKPQPQPDNNGSSQQTNSGGSGGSMGILTLIGLLGVAFKRKFF